MAKWSKHKQLTQVVIGAVTLTLGQTIQCAVNDKRWVAKIDEIRMVDEDKPWAKVTNATGESEWISLNNWKEQVDKGLFKYQEQPVAAPPPSSFMTTKTVAEDDICI